MHHSRRSLRLTGCIATASFLFASLICIPAHAEDAAELGRLLRNGQRNEAFNRIESALRANPNDAQMRFLKGVILSEQNKPHDAIAIFSKLAEDQPRLPEPHNNLAVLYAATGQYEKARTALEAAIRINPGYATAHENLGDVYAKLAVQSYQNALQLDAGNAAAKAKWHSVSTLLANGGGKSGSLPATGAAPAANTLPASTARTDRIPEKLQPAAMVDQEVMAVVSNWARFWSTKDVAAYLASYSRDFALPKGLSRQEWENNRRSRIVNKGNITVKVESVRVSVLGNTATVKFMQTYSSDRYKDNTLKTLVLTKQNGTWKITEESTGS